MQKYKNMRTIKEKILCLKYRLNFENIKMEAIENSVPIIISNNSVLLITSLRLKLFFL